MREADRSRSEWGRAAGDPGPAVDRTEALRERLFGNALGALGALHHLSSVNDSGCIGHSQKAVRPPRRSWPYALNHRTVRAGVA